MNRYLIRKVIYPAYRAIMRDNVLDYLAEMHRVERLEPDEIREFQWKKFKALLEYSARHVPYYRDVFKRLGAEPADIKTRKDLESFPVLRKDDIRANSEALISEIYPRRWLDPDSTGGSTGKNLYFSVCKEASEARRANNIRHNRWIDIELGDKIAMLWGTAFDMERAKKITNAIKSRMSNTLLLSAYRMDRDSVGDYAAKLRRFKPDLMVGYPSALSHFSASLIEAGENRIRPRALVLSGETLYDHQREVMEKAFQAKVYNHYGCREFGAIARECKQRNGLHIAAERVLLEVNPVADSASGERVSELLVTDLDSFGMPFIRYAIEDMGSITWDKCSCGLGLPRLETTIGRTFDVVRAPNGNFLGGTFWSILLRKKQGIERWQVIQEKLDEITIAFIPTDDFSDEVRRYVMEKVREACGDEMKVRFELKPSLDTTPTGKHRFVISKIGLKAEAESPEQGDAGEAPG
jgi:phenylacetate-CoA ligase